MKPAALFSRALEAMHPAARHDVPATQGSAKRVACDHRAVGRDGDGVNVRAAYGKALPRRQFLLVRENDSAVAAAEGQPRIKGVRTIYKIMLTLYFLRDYVEGERPPLLKPRDSALEKVVAHGKNAAVRAAAAKVLKGTR